MTVTKEQLVNAVQQVVKDGRLSCEQAHELGRELGVPLRDIGAVCNELKIKITACQLGCF
jgi:polyhydroxyalkanoate synthesis regulator phasin